MSTITKEFTKEQLIEHIKGRKEFADECAADSTLHPERREYYELTAEALRIALASLEAEPVGTFRKGPCGYSPSFHEDAMLLYTAPQKLIVPEEAVKVARAALDYIDALPPDVVASLPAMPGFDRDWAENVLAEAVPKEVGKCT